MLILWATPASTPKRGTPLYFFSVCGTWTKQNRGEKYFLYPFDIQSCCEISKEEIKILVEVNKTALPESYMRCSLKKDSLGAKNLACQAVQKPIPPPPAEISHSRKPLLLGVPKYSSSSAVSGLRGCCRGPLVAQWLRPPGFDLVVGKLRSHNPCSTAKNKRSWWVMWDHRELSARTLSKIHRNNCLTIILFLLLSQKTW